MGYNLPPGCSVADIDRACGADQPVLCGAHSPDGKYQCTVNLEAPNVTLDENDQHEGEHVAHQEVVLYSYEPPCDNPKCPEPTKQNDYYGCNHHVPPGSWTDSDDWGGSGQFVIVARWPRCDDDFDEHGNPTQRKEN